MTTKPILVLLLALLAAVALANPIPEDDNDDKSAGSRPLIEFTKGGIRVNFGGYHAQAGLGGLLTGSWKDGGLHASAGTPSGAHAGAGVGGSLDGGPAGGIHARAGLGNGGPEAQAGLSGSLGGKKPEGELYAGGSVGGFKLEKRINGIDDIPRTKGKNIQVIPKKKVPSNDLNDVATSSDAIASGNNSKRDTNAADGNNAYDLWKKPWF